MECWQVYILLCADGSYYTGSSCDVARRLSRHNSGEGAKYTRGRGPCTVAYTESCGTKSAALRREAAIKKLTHEQKAALAAGNTKGNE